MMLVWGSQSCVRNGDKAGHRCEENGGEPRQISLEHVSCRLWRRVPLLCLCFFIGMYPLLSLNSALMLHLGSCKRISRATAFL